MLCHPRLENGRSCRPSLLSLVAAESGGLHGSSADEGGLAVLRNGLWQRVPPIDDVDASVVVHVGDFLDIATRGALK